MTNSFAETVLSQPAPAPRSQDTLLVASLLHLMSHYTAHRDGEQPCVKLASVIERHLCALSRLPDADPVLRATCEQLAERWAGLVDEKLPRPQAEKQTLLARFMRATGAHGSRRRPGFNVRSTPPA